MFPTCLGVLLDFSAITFVRKNSANRAIKCTLHIVLEQFHNQDNTEQFAAAMQTPLVSQEGELCFMHYIYHDMVMTDGALLIAYALRSRSMEIPSIHPIVHEFGQGFH